ncbi:MAG: hypothetical protein ABI200_05880 [Gaiellales bacterium]
MKTFRRIIAVAMCGVMLGGLMSIMGASPATARIYRQCDKKVDVMEMQAAKVYEKAEQNLSKAQEKYDKKPTQTNEIKLQVATQTLSTAQVIYERVMDESAYHRELWGC